MTSNVSDKALMRRVQADDPDAFGVLYDRLAPRAMRVAAGVLRGDANRAEEAVQEGFISMWRARDRYRPEQGHVHAWAFGIVRNRAIDNLRQGKVHEIRRADLEGHPQRLPAGVDLEGTVLADAAAGDLRGLLARLPEPQREVIALAYYGQLSHTEIAQRLAVPVGTVKGRMRLGLTRLRDQLA